MTRRWIGLISLVIAAAFLLGGCVQSGNPASRTGRVTGRVYDGRTGSVPAGVRATLSEHPIAVDGGMFSVSNLAAGTYRLQVEAPGFKTFFSALQVGDSTLSVEVALEPVETAPPDNPPSSRFSASDLDLLARLVRAEAEGEPYEGKVAVAATVLHRVDDPGYPNTIPGVIYQVWDGKYVQYEPVMNGTIDLPADEASRRAVQDAVRGVDPSFGAIGFYNPSKTSNQWVRNRQITTIIGNHYFFK